LTLVKANGQKNDFVKSWTPLEMNVTVVWVWKNHCTGSPQCLRVFAVTLCLWALLCFFGSTSVYRLCFLGGHLVFVLFR